LHYPPIQVLKYEQVNDCCISFEPHIRIWSRPVTFDMLLVSSLDNIFVQYDMKISCALSTNTSIQI
jgi:hypothetical protein